MKIILDAMGGDNAPDANIKGAVNAINKVKAEVILVGKEEVIRNRVKEIYGKEIEEISDRLKIQNATETIEMEDQPTVAIKHKKDIALANKETLVCAGKLVMSEAKKNGVKILPVDSEHSAIFQSLNGENYKEIEKVILTASGGPFRGKKKEELLNVTKNEALKHPNWSMGRKISIDSSTLMNKGLEVIEAKWLFDVEVDQIDVVVHPQSIIHSMVQFNDSSVIAQLGCPDMRLPIQYALTYPERLENGFERLDLTKIATLTFEEPDLETFPCLQLAYETLKMGGTYSAVLNSANEVLVEAFLEDKIGFYDIPKYIKETLDAHKSIEEPTLEEILEVDRWTREYVKSLIK